MSDDRVIIRITCPTCEGVRGKVPCSMCSGKGAVSRYRPVEQTESLPVADDPCAASSEPMHICPRCGSEDTKVTPLDQMGPVGHRHDCNGCGLRYHDSTWAALRAIYGEGGALEGAVTFKAGEGTVSGADVAEAVRNAEPLTMMATGGPTEASNDWTNRIPTNSLPEAQLPELPPEKMLRDPLVEAGERRWGLHLTLPEIEMLVTMLAGYEQMYEFEFGDGSLESKEKAMLELINTLHEDAIKDAMAPSAEEGM